MSFGILMLVSMETDATYKYCETNISPALRSGPCYFVHTTQRQKMKKTMSYVIPSVIVSSCKWCSSSSLTWLVVRRCWKRPPCASVPAEKLSGCDPFPAPAPGPSAYAQAPVAPLCSPGWGRAPLLSAHPHSGPAWAHPAGHRYRCSAEGNTFQFLQSPLFQWSLRAAPVNEALFTPTGAVNAI